MQRRIMQGAALAMLLAMTATPAFARGNDDRDNEGRGRGLGIFASLKKELKLDIKELRKEAKKELKEARDLRKADRDDDDEDEDDNEDAKKACLRAAESAHEVAVKAANSERKTTLVNVRAAYHDALEAAKKIRHEANVSAHATFRAGTKDGATISAFVNAWVKAQTDWHKARAAAQSAFETAKVAAEAKWKTAKLKADADFKTAKDKCKEAPAPTPTPTPTDTVAPSAVTLSLSAATSTSALLTWTAPGDDGSVGTAASYDIRYSTSPIATAADFDAATQVTGEPTPAVAGTVQTLTVTGLTASTTYHFAIKSKDEAANVSAMSNAASITTLALADVTAPGAITTLTVSGPTATSLVAAWVAPGDDGSIGTAASYDIRYSTSPIVTAADFSGAVQISGEPTPTAAGTTQSMTVSGLSSATTYYFAMKAQDEVPNVSAMSNATSATTL